MSLADSESTLDLIELRRVNAALKREKALREAYGINFYRPHWKQHKFHVADAVARYLRTGNRFGKSECGICEDVAWCMGGRVWYREAFDVLDGQGNVRYHHPGGKNHPLVTSGIPRRPLKGLILVVDWDKAKEIFTHQEGSFETWGKLWKFLPREFTGHVTKGGRGDRVIKVEIKRPAEFGGGSSTLTFDTIESYKHNRMGAESDNWDFIHVDEPCPESMFKAHSRGLIDRRGSYWFTCTPLDEMWINDHFTPPGKTALGIKDDETFSIQLESGRRTGNRYIITGEITDNPHLTQEAIDEFESGLTREEKLCRLKGMPLAMAGAVYKEFVYDMHVLADVPHGWEDFHLPPRDYTIRVAWDVHGARLPQAVMFAATAPTGDVFIYDEQFFEPLIAPNAELLVRKIQNRNVISKIIDPRACIVNPVTETADLMVALESYGLYFEPASKDLTTGIIKVREKLNERHVVTKLPTIYFSPNLRQTLYEFSHYVFDLEKNEPKDKDNHMMENLYRLVLNGLEYVEPPNDTKTDRRPVTIRFDEDQRGFRVPSNLLRL